MVAREIRATVASLRADSIAAAGFGMSRSKAANDIDLAKVSLNGKLVAQASQAVKVGDELAHVSRGRLRLTEITGTTKKKRLGVLLTRVYSDVNDVNNGSDNNTQREGQQSC